MDTFRRVSTPAVLTAMLAVLAVGAAAQEARTQLAYPTGSTGSSILLLERIAPASVKVNSEFEYILRLSNLTNAEIRAITLTEQPSPELDVRGATPAAGQQGNEMGWRIESLPPRAAAEFRIRAVARRTGEVSGCANIILRAEACSAIRIVQPALELVKSAPEQVLLCDPIPIRFTVTNPGTGVATNVRIEDPLPDGWQVDGAGGDIAINVGNLAPGQSRDFSVTARASRTGAYTNTAIASADDGLSAQASAATRIVKPALRLAKSGPSLRYLGRPAEFTLELTNDGDAPATQTTLTDMFPAALQFVAASDGGRFQNGRVTWPLGTINPGETRRVTVTAQTREIGSYVNQAVASAYCAETAAELPFEIRGVPAVLLEVVDLEDPDEIGTTETYVITVTNQGTAVGTGIRVTCEVQQEAEYVSADGPTAPSAAGRTVTFAPLATLAPKARATYRVIVRGQQAGDTRFKVTLTTDQTQGPPVEETESTRFY